MRKSTNVHDMSLLSMYLFFLLAACLTLFIQAVWRTDSWFSNIYVTDAETLYDSLMYMIENSVSFTQYLEEEDARIVFFIYQPLYMITRSPIAFILPNILMLSVCFFCTYQTFKPLGYRSAYFSAISLSINPYILLSITGISKEIPLCAATSVLFFLMKKKSNIRVILILLLCFISYGIRPAYGAMLASYFLPCLILSKDFINKFRGIMIAIPFFFIAVFTTLTSYIPGLQRLVTIQQGLDAGTELGRANLERTISSLESGGLSSCIELLFRTFSNIFSLILRPSFTTNNNHISLLGIGFWIYGLLLSISMVGTFIIFFRIVLQNKLSIMSQINRIYIKDLVFGVIYLVPAISLSLIIQPRYLMPILPASMGFLGTLSLKSIYKIAVLMLIVSILGYFYLTFFAGIEPIKSIDSPHKPNFVLNI